MRRAWPIVLLALAGCLPKVGPDYARPEAATPERWRLAPAEAESLANLKWWEVFDDETLQGLVRAALAGNHDLLRAAAAVERAAARAGVARSDLFPQTQADASATLEHISERSRFGGGGFIDPQDDIYVVAGSLAWELDLWGRIRRLTESARAELLAAEQARRGVVVTLVAETALAYLELRDLDAELEIARRTLESRREDLALAERRLKGGVISELDYRQAEAETATTEAVVPELERRIVRKENELSVLLGRPPGDIPRGRPIEALAMRAEAPAGLPSTLLERRPDVAEAEQRLVAANAEIGAAKALFFPRLTLTGRYGVESVQFSELFTQPAQTWSIGPGLSAPLFTAGKVLDEVEAARARAREAEETWRRTALVALREVEDALIDRRKTEERRVAEERQVDALRKALRLAQLRYEEGYTDYTTVLVAQRSLLLAELSLVQTQRAQGAALIQLYKALGGGWSPDDPAVRMEEPAAPYVP